MCAPRARSSVTVARTWRIGWITGNVVPDHATIARFIVRHHAALADLFSEVLRLCDRAGLVKAGVVAIDGTRLSGNASRARSQEFGKIAEEIVEQVRARDEAEDEMLGEERGGELPEPLRTAEGRREFFRQARHTLAGENESEELAEEREVLASPGPEFEFDPDRIVARVQGRKGWLRDAERQLEQHRWQHPDPVGRSRAERLLQAAERLEGDLAAERAGNEAVEHRRVHGRDAQGRRLAGTPTPYEPPAVPAGKVNVTDPDSKLIKAYEGYV
jgi:hypothetical protein